jgi:hypothetical protein
VKTLNSWLKVTVAFEPSFNLAYSGLDVAQCFEAKFKIQNMYFSRYVTTLKNSLEISCQTAANVKAIRRWFQAKNYVLGLTIENRGSGSMAHAHAYRAISAMALADRDKEDSWDPMLDVIHWMCNMRGYDYLREIRFYGYGAFCFANQVAHQNDEFQAKLQGKAPAGKAAKSASNGARQSKPAGSSRVAARKVSG